ncbi:MAG: alginate lyase family protein [Bacteroidales bacterium]|nr:alginate lyase family protein [Bacteroidales bacterium]
MKIKIKYIFLLCTIFSVFSIQSQTRIWNMKSLEKAKSSNSEACKLIIRDADKALNKTIATVMDKGLAPTSGDKHDYFSSGRYWWPDPSKPDGLPYIRKDGVVNREIDNLDRAPLGAMARSVYTLSLAYYLTSDYKYAKKAVENIRIWFLNKETKMNPNMNFGQTIPGRNNGKGRGEGILDTYSFVEMLDGIELLKGSSEFTKKDREALVAWFTEYLNWMQTSEIGKEEFSAKNNHGTAFDVQVTRYALFVEKEDIAKNVIDEFPTRRLFKQIEPDGSQPFELVRTTALGYSVFNLTHFIDMCWMAKSLKIDLFNAKSTDGRSIDKACSFLANYVGKEQNEFPYKQIKEWDSVQKKLQFELYRSDLFREKPIYKSLYENEIARSQKNIDLIFN